MKTQCIGICAAFIGGSFLTFLSSSMFGLTFKPRTVTTNIQRPMVRPEYRTYDDNRLLKNEINRLSQDNKKLRKLLQDLNSYIEEENLRATKPKGILDLLKISINNISYPGTDQHLHFDDTRVADKLYNKTRVLCWVMTHAKNLQTRAITIQRTWGRRCNKLLFFSSVGNDTFPVIGLGTGEGREFLTAKTFKAFRYVYKYYFNDYDWFMRTDDDAYVIMENLRYFLSGQDNNSPVYFGHKFKVIVKQGYFSGGPGIVLSKEALKRFSSTKGVKRCPDDSKNGVDDVEIGFCMERLGVQAGNSLDNLGRTRFHCFEPAYHLMGTYPDWFYKYDANGAKWGVYSMSDYAIGFHYVSTSVMYLLEYAVYHLRPYGILFADQDLNIPIN